MTPSRNDNEARLCRALIEQMDAFYTRLDRLIAAHTPVCRNRGACCRFDSFGHELYVTSIELLYFLHHHPAPTQRSVGAEPTALEVINSQSPRQCPYQQQGRCTARYARPVGCRTFFCESSQQGWQQSLTEQALAELKKMHTEYSVPYAYGEWLKALKRHLYTSRA